MTQDVSGFGARVTVLADKTFPGGFNLSQFADDVDPFDIPSLQIAEKAMGANGDLITWGKASPVTIALAVIPGTEDDRNLQALYDANRIGKGKSSARDLVTITVVYPDGRSLTLTQGRLTDGPPGMGMASSGRLKTPTYQFAFENSARS